MKLHGTVGPARTTVSGVAKEAGVQRATVYRHFPTEEDLFDACTAHYWARHPLPDIEAWREVRDPRERLRRGLAEFYDFYEENEQMLEKTGRDAPVVPAMDVPRARRSGIPRCGRRQPRGRPAGARRRPPPRGGGDRPRAVLPDLAVPARACRASANAEAVAVMAGMIDSAGRSRPR